MKKILSTMLAFLMLSTLIALPFSAQAGKFPNTDLSITSLRADNGLPVGQTAKAADAVFEVTCNDNNGAEWIVGSGSATYWATSSGTKLTSSDTISQNSSYKLQLCVYPDVVNTEEDEVDINEVKQITFNGVPLTTSQYSRGEFGNCIYITVNFYYANITGATGAGFYIPGEAVTVSADKAPSGQHFSSWKGAYGAGGKYRFAIDFSDSSSPVTTFKMPVTSFNYVNPVYEDHSPVAIDSVPATCTAAGKTSGVKCSVCDEILTAQEVIPAKGHNFGSNSEKCLVCGITNPNYKAPVQTTPTITNSIIFGGVTYTLKNGEYVATKAAKASVKKLVKAKKAFKVTYSKVAGVTGYQVQYSTSKSFTKATTKSKLYSGNKKFTKTVSKLKANKKYYVRVRTYKTTTINGITVKLYSSWSKAKSVKTKK